MGIDTLCENGAMPRLPKSLQLKRLHRVIEAELTQKQREILVAYYFQDKSMTQIARERGISVSTVSRTLHRAEVRVRRCLQY